MADLHHHDNKDIASGDSIRKILVVDNDASTAELIRDNIAPDGFIVDAVSADDNSFSINLAQYKLYSSISERRPRAALLCSNR